MPIIDLHISHINMKQDHLAHVHKASQRLHSAEQQ